MPQKSAFLLPLAAFTAMSLPAYAAAKSHVHRALAHDAAQPPAARKGVKPLRPIKATLHEKPTKASKTAPNSRHHQREVVEDSPRMSRVKDLRHGQAVPALKPLARVTKPAKEPQNVEVTPDPGLPAIVTHHDRHVHLSPSGGAAEAQPETPATVSEKATSDDFVTAAIAPAPALIAAAEVAPVRRSAPIVRVQKAMIAPVLDPVVVPKQVSAKALIPVVAIPYTPLLYNERGRLIVPAALKGSHEILLHQNEMADHDGLDRVQDDEDLERMRSARLLVAIPDVAGLDTDERLPANRRYVRSWTAAFLSSMAKAHYARFHSSLQVNSAVRTVEFQQKLLRTNGNAAPAEGSTASPHLTGQAVDIAKHGLSMTEIAWLRGFLLPLVQEGKIDVEEEFQQACFHISVYKIFVPQAAPKREIEGTRRRVGTALAAAID